MADQLPPNPDPILNQPITPAVVEKHGVLPDEFEVIKQALGREPTLTELGIYSVMWSERCSYKNSRPLLKSIPTEKKNAAEKFGRVLVKAGEEKAGIVDVGDDWAIAFKFESHNYPSASEPFEGAAPRVGGIVRDIFTMGARPALITSSLRFGELDSPATKRILRGVVSGISNYGSCIGVHTVGGDVYFDPCYEDNPLVNVLCLGTLRHDQIKRGKASGIGNPVYYVGAATGRDGVGGAAFASKELSAASKQDRPAVQKGDPSMEKLLNEACLEMIAVPGLVVGIQDMGAAGLTCSICETASRGSTGIEIELDRVPQREPGMNSYEIMLSDSQERMLVIGQKDREREIEEIFAKWDLHAARIGVLTGTGRIVVKLHDVTVADIPVTSLTERAPIYQREAKEPAYFATTSKWTPLNAQLPDVDADGVREILPKLLSHPTIASKRWLYRQYDYLVQHDVAVVEQGSDAAVVRLRLGEKEKIIAVSNDCNGRYCYLNPHRGAVIAMLECMRNLVCAGATPLAMTNTLNFGDPSKPENFYQLRECVKGLADACRYFDVPAVGSNVSLYNESLAGAIDPTPVVSIVGYIEDEKHVTKQFAQKAGDKLILLGGAPTELGGSQFLGVVHDLKTGDAPQVDLPAEEHLQTALLTLIKGGNASAAHSLSKGGLLVAVAEMLFTPGSTTFGAKLDLTAFDIKRVDALLFGESQGRVVIAVPTEKAVSAVAVVKGLTIPATVIGEVVEAPTLVVKAPAIGEVSWLIADLREDWETAIERAMATPKLE